MSECEHDWHDGECQTCGAIDCRHEDAISVPDPITSAPRTICAECGQPLPDDELPYDEDAAYEDMRERMWEEKT